jgi:hypothetical protein
LFWHRFSSVTKSDEPVAVDAVFAQALEEVDAAALGVVSGAGTGELVGALGILDGLIACSEAYVANPMQGQIYFSDKFSVVGERGSSPLTIDMDGGEFARLRGLVGAARAVVSGAGSTARLAEYVG